MPTMTVDRVICISTRTKLRRKLEALVRAPRPQDQKQAIQEVLDSLPRLEKILKEQGEEAESARAQAAPALPAISLAILAGQQKYTKIQAPALAIYAMPHASGSDSGADAAARRPPKPKTWRRPERKRRLLRAVCPWRASCGCRMRITTSFSRTRRMSCAR